MIASDLEAKYVLPCLPIRWLVIHRLAVAAGVRRLDGDKQMEHTYHDIESRASLFIIGIPFTVFGGLFAVIGVLCALGNQTSSGDSFGRIFTGVMFAVVGSATAYIGWDQLMHRPWLIMSLADGTIEFRRAFRSTRLRASTITALEKRGRQEDSEGLDSRVLMLRHPGGSIPISYFDEIEALIADIHSRNPAVLVHGWWT